MPNNFKRGLRIAKGSFSNAWVTPEGKIIKTGRKEHGFIVAQNADRFNLDRSKIDKEQPDEIKLVEMAVDQGAIRIAGMKNGLGLMIKKSSVTKDAFEESQKYIKSERNYIESVTVDFIKGGRGNTRVSASKTVDPRAYINADGVDDIDDFQPSAVQRFHGEDFLGNLYKKFLNEQLDTDSFLKELFINPPSN